MKTKTTGTGTGLADLYQSGSLRTLFPRGPRMTSVLVNTAGGVTGGDRFKTDVVVGPKSELTITTQAAERAYAAVGGQTGKIENRLAIAKEATGYWLPQETILFDGCSLSRRLTVDLATSAKLLLVEPLAFGRAAMGETLTDAHFSDRIEIRRDGRIVYLDAMAFDGDVSAHLSRPNVANGAGAMATVIYIADNGETKLDHLVGLLPCTAGASLIRNDILVVRMLATDTFELRRSLIPVLNYLSGAPLPRPWMI